MRSCAHWSAGSDKTIEHSLECKDKERSFKSEHDLCWIRFFLGYCGGQS